MEATFDASQQQRDKDNKHDSSVVCVFVIFPILNSFQVDVFIVSVGCLFPLDSTLITSRRDKLEMIADKWI